MELEDNWAHLTLCKSVSLLGLRFPYLVKKGTGGRARLQDLKGLFQFSIPLLGLGGNENVGHRHNNISGSGENNALTQTVDLGFIWSIDFLCWDPLLVLIKIADKNTCLHWLNFPVSIFPWLQFSLTWGYKRGRLHTDKQPLWITLCLRFRLTLHFLPICCFSFTWSFIAQKLAGC